MGPANLIDGRAIAAQVLGELAARIAALKSRGIQPGLAFIRVGEDPASKVYVGRKEKACADLGIFSETQVLPEADHRGRIAGADPEVERRRSPPRHSGSGAVASAYSRGVDLFERAAAKGRRRVSSGERGQADAGRSRRVSIRARRRAFANCWFVRRCAPTEPRSWCWAAETLWASRWRRCFARKTSTPTRRSRFAIRPRATFRRIAAARTS